MLSLSGTADAEGRGRVPIEVDGATHLLVLDGGTGRLAVPTDSTDPEIVVDPQRRSTVSRSRVKGP
ncbi:MAG: hypothetical protein GY913_31025 [Proteobacteria bacterium]|nr:hypothetical protein [Pseudomonadota bacterium]MCP4921351.1 hypothetical protein [Pseudomonadota bacterium]